MANKKKVNPKKKPVTQADLKKAKNAAVDEAVKFCWVIYMTAMRDKEGYDNEALHRLWGHISALSDSVAKGYVSVSDLANTLKVEAEMELI